MDPRTQYKLGPLAFGPMWPYADPLGQQHQGPTQDLTQFLDPRHYYDQSLPDPNTTLPGAEDWLNAALQRAGSAAFNSPFAQDVGHAVRPALSSVGEGINNAGMYFGLPDTLGQHSMMPPGLLDRVTPGVANRAQAAAQTNPMISALGPQGGGNLSFKGPALPTMTPAAHTNFDAANAELDLAKPGPDGSELKDEDKLLYVLGGLADTGALDAKSVGDLLFALGTGSIRGLGAFEKERRGEAAASAREDRAYHGQKAGVLADEAGVLGRENQQDAARQDEFGMKRFELGQPKISGNAVVTTDVGKDNTTYSVQQLPDQDFNRALGLMSAAGQQPTSPSGAILAGEDFGGAPEEALGLRTFVLDLRQKVAASQEFRDAIAQVQMSNMGGADKVDYNAMLDMYTDVAMQRLDPNQYAQLMALMSQKQMMRGLSGMFSKPRLQ